MTATLPWRSICLAGAITALSGACAPKEETPDPADLQAARQAALTFDVRLKAEMLDRIEREEDPVAVYLAYRDNVREMTTRAGADAGVTLKRTALRVRNPENAADDWEFQKMEEFEFLIQAGLDPETLGVAEIVEEDEQRVLRWIRPLKMTETCLVCHGDEIDVRLLDLFARDYPDDEAVGYFAEEPGGAYSVRKVLD